MAGRKKTPVLERMEEAVTKAVTRSPLSEWLNENRAGFADLLARHGARWEVLASVLSEEGLTAAEGKPISGETLRGAWRRLEKRRSKLVRPRTPRSEPTAARLTPTPAPSTLPTPPKQPGAAPTGSRADEKLAKLEEQLQSRRRQLPPKM